MTTRYVVDTQAKAIVNAIESSKSDQELTESFAHIWPAPRYKLTRNPSMSMLEGYRYWNERP